MHYSFETIVVAILLIDSLSAAIVTWSGHGNHFMRHFKIFSRAFPLNNAWTTYYLILVLWMVFMLYRFNAL